MKQEDLLDAIGEVDDAYVAKAEIRHAFPGWLKTIALCALLAMALMVLAIPFHTLDFGCYAPGPTYVFDPDYEIPLEELNYPFYAGPLLPLTLLEDCPDITAARRVEYTFPSYRASDYDRRGYSGYANVTETYILTNEAEEPRTVTLVYPFISRLIFKETFPTYTMNGEPVTLKLNAGPFTGYYPGVNYSPHELKSYLEYAELLADGSYYDRAMDEPNTLDIPVTVYQLKDFVNNSDVERPVLRMEYSYDPEQTMIFLEGLSGIDEYEDTGIRYSSIRIHPGDYTEVTDFYLIVLGTDLENYTIRTFRNFPGYIGGDELLEDVSCTVEKFESTLGEMLRLIVGDGAEQHRYRFHELDPLEGFYVIPPEDLEMTLQLSAEMLYDHGPLNPSPIPRFIQLNELPYSVYKQERVFCSTMEVTIPAGESVEFTVDRIQYRSYENGYSSSTYDLCTTLGSNLRFSEQTVRISDWDCIRLVKGENGIYPPNSTIQVFQRENYGLDPDNGITEVTLDLNKPYYWFEIVKKSAP